MQRVEKVLQGQASGDGIKRTPSYETPLTKHELDKWRKEFWGKYQLSNTSICSYGEDIYHLLLNFETTIVNNCFPCRNENSRLLTYLAASEECLRRVP